MSCSSTNNPGGVLIVVPVPGMMVARWRIGLFSSQFRELESSQVPTHIRSRRLFLVRKLACGKRESAS